MSCTKEDKAMESHFEITFPLVLTKGASFAIKFTLEKGSRLEFNNGLYFLHGDNGSGKSTFLNLLALTDGHIGKSSDGYKGFIKFNDEAYNGKDFSHIRAAELREKNFCIFPQKVFFLPVSTYDNYMILNGSDLKKAASFSPQEYPDLISGGQQQKILMDIVLDDKKPVWFLDEPLTNLDAEGRYYFWQTLYGAHSHQLSTVFYIDHWMGGEIKNDKNFQHGNTLRVVTENRQKGKPPDTGIRHIEVYENNSPKEFFLRQMQNINIKKRIGSAAVKTPGT